MSDEVDRYLTQCSTCRAFGPDVRFMGHRTGPVGPQHPAEVYLCRPCRQAQGFEPAGEPRPSVVK